MARCLKTTEVITRVHLIVISLATVGVGVAQLATTLRREDTCSNTLAVCLGPPGSLVGVAALAFTYECAMLLVTLTERGVHSSTTTAVTDFILSTFLALGYAAGSAAHSIWPTSLKVYFDSALDSTLQLEKILALSTIILGFVCVIAFTLAALSWACMGCYNAHRSEPEEHTTTTSAGYEMSSPTTMPMITSPLPPPPVEIKPPAHYTTTTSTAAVPIPQEYSGGTLSDENNADTAGVGGTSQQQHFKYQPNIYVPSPFVMQKDLPLKFSHK